ncbi:MAG: hypothetical protein ABH859_05250 [Pseudomonadota bacterium]
MKKNIVFMVMVVLLCSCGKVQDATNTTNADPDQNNVQASSTTRTHPADVAIALGNMAVVAAANWIDPIGSLASLNLLQNYVATLARATTDSSDLVIKSFLNFIFVINRFGADTIQVVDPVTYNVIANFSVGSASNPHDIWVVSDTKAYVSRFNAESDADNNDDLLIVDPLTGEQFGSIDLTAYTSAAGDGLARTTQMVAVGNNLFVCLTDLPQDLLQGANANGKVVVIDTQTDEVVAVVELAGRNPADITYSPLTGLVYITNAGVYDNFDTDITDEFGGIEVIDPQTLATLGIAIDDLDLGGYPTEIRLASASLGFVIVDGLYLASFNPTTYEVLNNSLYTTEGTYLPDFTIAENGDLLVTERSQTDPGIVVLDSSDGSLKAGPIPVGASPASITFVDIE